MHKAGTAQEAHQLHGKVPEEVYREVLRIVTILDRTYGADRDVDNGDGGFVLVAENVQDLEALNREYRVLDSNRHEAVSIVQCGRKNWLDVLILCNNEFGIDILIPADIALANIFKKKKGKISV